MLNIRFGAVAGIASLYGPGTTKMLRLLATAAPARQHS
jgi:hypothetical protein